MAHNVLARRLNRNLLKLYINGYNATAAHPCITFITNKIHINNLCWYQRQDLTHKQHPTVYYGYNQSISHYGTEFNKNAKEESKKEVKLSLFQRFKQMYRDYWYILVPVHVVTSVIWFGGFYYLAISGVDIIGLLETLQFSERIVNSLRDSSMGYIAVAYALYKITTPIRYTVTLGGTTISIQYLTKWGYIKPVPSKERLVKIYQETKEGIKEKKEIIIGSVKEKKESVIESVKEKKDSVIESVKDKKDSMIESVKEKKDAVLESVKEKGHKIKPKKNKVLGNSVEERNVRSRSWGKPKKS